MGFLNFGKKKEVPCCGEGNESMAKSEERGCGCGETNSVEEEKEFNEDGEEMTMCDCGNMCKISDIEAKKSGEKSLDEKGAWIKVLGPGCKKCTELEKNAKEALSKMGKSEEIDHVTDFAEIAAYGVMNTPALVVDGKVVSSGKVLKADEIVKILDK